MLRPPFHTLGEDEEGERALSLLPEASKQGEPTLIYGRSLQRFDTWMGTTLKTTLEYHCVVLGNSVTLDPPPRSPTLARLGGLLGQVPAGFHLADDRPLPTPIRTNTYVPAISLRGEDDAVRAAEVLYYRSAGLAPAVRRAAAHAFAVLAHNGLTHGRSSATGVTVAAAYHPGTNEVQVLASDLGEPVSQLADSEDFLRDLHERAVQAHTSLAHLVELNQRLGVPCKLIVAAGAARLRWGSEIQVVSGPQVPGVTAAFVISDAR